MTDSILLTPRRMLADIAVQCTLEEQHSDSLTITDHPVERGAPVSDHAYRRPSELVMKVAWSNSSLSARLDPGYVKDVYDKLLALQQTMEPFAVTTGKRKYRNMLIAGLAVTTDAATENVLMVTATLREVIRVQTQVVSVPPADVQANPRATAAPVQTGAAQPRPAVMSPPSTGG